MEAKYFSQASIVQCLSRDVIYCKEVTGWNLYSCFYSYIGIFTLFFYLGFSFTNIHNSQDSRGRGGYLLNSSLSLPPPSQKRHLDINRTTTVESSFLHIASSRTQTGNLWFFEHKSVTTKLRVSLKIRGFFNITFENHCECE